MAYNIDVTGSDRPIAPEAPPNRVDLSGYSTDSKNIGFPQALNALGGVSYADASGRITDANGEFLRMSKYTREELIGQNHAILNSGHHPKAFWIEAYLAFANCRQWRAQIKNRAKDGTFYWVDTLVVPITDTTGALTGYLSFQIDITDTVTAHIELQEHTRLLQSVVECFPGGIAIYDKEDRLVICNETQKRLLDYPQELFAEGPPTLEQLLRFNAARGEYGPGNIEDHVRRRLTLAQRREAHNFERRRPDGTYVEVRGTPLSDGGFVTTYLDITDRKRDQATIGRLAHHDALTGLPNRALFLDRIKQGLARVRRGELLALHFLDLDRFKSVNDTLGHPTGDALLKAVAQRLRNSIRETDTVARLGGDEFAVIQIAPKDFEEVEQLARKIIHALRRPFQIGESTIAIGTSIGIAVAPTDGVEAEELMKNADMALYRTKSDGRGHFGFFEKLIQERLQARHSLASDLRDALTDGAFELHYQPIVNVQSRRVVGCEALIRWPHPTRGMVPASDFIPIAEECGLIGEIGDWVLKRACKEALAWPSDIWVAVNISAAQFRCRDLFETVQDALRGLAPNRLILEITETLLMKDRDSASTMLEQLRSIGIRFAIDDFGTGFSSLSYLQSFPFDKIKIDRSFVSQTADQQRSSTLRRSIIQLGHNLSMTSVAEGVETEHQLELLKAEGCLEAQGFLFSRALPGSKIIEFFDKPL